MRSVPMLIIWPKPILADKSRSAMESNSETSFQRVRSPRASSVIVLSEVGGAGLRFGSLIVLHTRRSGSATSSKTLLIV